MEPSNEQNPQNPQASTGQSTPQPLPEQPRSTSQPEPIQPVFQPQPAQPQPSFQNQDSVIEDNPKKSSKKTTVVLVIILAILVVAGIGFGIWMAISGNQKPAENPPVTPVEPSEEEEEPSEDEPIAEEVELTDANIIKDLDQKIANLHVVTEYSSPNRLQIGGMHFEYELYNGQPLSEKYKNLITSIALQNQYRKPTEDELATLKTDFSEYYNFGSDAQPNNSQNYISVISADVFDDKYEELFGGNPSTKPTSPKDIYCMGSTYSNTLDLYFTYEGCGGASSFVTDYYIDHYTTKGDYVYAYIYVSTFDHNGLNIYCGAPNSYEDTSLICGNAAEDYNPDASNPEYSGQYRFTFKKADNGTYYFDKVEKIENTND